MPLISREGSVRPQESSRAARRPLATSSPASTAATSFGMSSGRFWRSPSIVTTMSPRARTRPACIAGCWPKFRLKRTARTRGSAACSRSSVGKRAVDRAVVDVHDLERPPEAVERDDSSAVELVERADLVVQRDNDRQLGRRLGVVGRSVCGSVSVLDIGGGA